MATKISGFDLFSLVEELINEKKNNIDADAIEINSLSDSENLEKSFISATESLGVRNEKAAKKRQDSKGKKMSGKKAKEEVEDSEKVDDKDNSKEEVKTPDDSPTTLKLTDALEYSKFVDDLNKFRSAHSFDDEDIAKELKKYYQKLEEEEKKVFYVILKGLIHVTLMGVDGKAARTPSEVKFNIKKMGNTDKEKRDSAARKIDASRQGKEIDTQMPIDTIQIGNVSDGVIRQDKSKIYEVLRKNA